MPAHGPPVQSGSLKCRTAESFASRPGEIASAPQLWDVVEREGERWLAECAPPFWGRPGKRRPTLPEHHRRTEREVATIGGHRAKSVFQVGGAGTVGTGSFRGMPMLRQLREAGFAVWPFDDARLPMVVEIYPRVLTGAVRKTDVRSRRAFLTAEFPDLEPDVRGRAADSDDAFDALVSALRMDAHLIY